MGAGASPFLVPVQNPSDSARVAGGHFKHTNTGNVMSRFIRSTLLLLALSSAAQAEDQDYSHRVCSLEHPQLDAATYTSQLNGSGCLWKIKGGGSLVLTVSDTDLDNVSEQMRQMLNQMQASVAEYPEVKVERAALGVCEGDDYVEVSALGDSSGFSWARCGKRLLGTAFEGPQGQALAKAMTAAARDAKW